MSPAGRAALLVCACFAASAAEPPPDPEASKSAAAAKPAARESGDFKPPPGFRAQKRRGLTPYCRKEAELGSRFKSEKCYDEAGIKDLQRAERETEEMMNRISNCAAGTCPIT